MEQTRMHEVTGVTELIYSVTPVTSCNFFNFLN